MINDKIRAYNYMLTITSHFAKEEADQDTDI